jgi:hypothetical protein
MFKKNKVEKKTKASHSTYIKKRRTTPSKTSSSKKERTDVNGEEADEMAKKTCHCNLCPRSDQTKTGGSAAYQGPFNDPTGQKERFNREAQGTRKNPFNHRKFIEFIL